MSDPTYDYYKLLIAEGAEGTVARIAEDYIKKKDKGVALFKLEAAKIAIGIYTTGYGTFEEAVKKFRQKEKQLDYNPISDWKIGRIRQDGKKEAEVAEDYDIDIFFNEEGMKKQIKRVKISKIMYYTVEKKRVVKRPVYTQFLYTGDEIQELASLTASMQDELKNSTVDGEKFPVWWKKNLNKIIPEKIGKYIYEDLQGKGAYIPTGNPMGRPKGEKKARPSRAKEGAIQGRPKKKRNPVGRPKKPAPPTEDDGLKVLTKANKGITVGVKKKFYPVKVITAKKQLTQKQLDALGKARAAKKQKNKIPLEVLNPKKFRRGKDGQLKLIRKKAPPPTPKQPPNKKGKKKIRFNIKKPTN